MMATVTKTIITIAILVAMAVAIVVVTAAILLSVILSPSRTKSVLVRYTVSCQWYVLVCREGGESSCYNNSLSPIPIPTAFIAFLPRTTQRASE